MGAVIAIGPVVGFIGGAFASHFPGSSADWAAWVQGIGSLLGLAVAVGIAFYQSVAASKALRRANDQTRIDAHNDQIRILETAKNIVFRMGAVLATIIDSRRPRADGIVYNLRADVQTFVTLGDVLKAVPMFNINDADALAEIVGALNEIDRYRIMTNKNAFNAELGDPASFEKHHDRLGELIGDIRTRGPVPTAAVGTVHLSVPFLWSFQRGWPFAPTAVDWITSPIIAFSMPARLPIPSSSVGHGRHGRRQSA
jgi:hypothetical protein